MGTTTAPPKLPPVWFKHLFWRSHRLCHRIGGRHVLWTPQSKRGWGALHLTTVGRRTGRHRSVIVGYLEDGPNLVVMAMNGWDEGLPAWWLNLEADPRATVRLADGTTRAVRAVEATGAERARLWGRWAEVDEGLDAYAASRVADTPVVVLEPALPST